MSIVTKKFKITNMHCASCAMSIDMELEDMDGVNSAITSFAKSVTEVEFDSDKVQNEVIMETIKKIGYSALPLE